MANLKIQLKRHNGTGYDVLHPETEIVQVAGLQDELDSRVLLSQLGADGDGTASTKIATLDANNKLMESQIPSWLLNDKPSLMFVVSANTSENELMTAVNQYFTENSFPNKSAAYGKYILFTGEYCLYRSASQPNGTAEAHTFSLHYYGEEDGGNTYLGEVLARDIDFETGDMLLFTKYIEGTLDNGWKDEYYFSFINNAYDSATTQAHGIVRLSDSESTASTGTKVITEFVLNRLMGTGATQIAKGNHDHTGVYQPASDALDTLAGLTPTDGSIIVGNGTAWAVESGATARESLGLTIGTDVQEYDAGLASIAALTTAADKLVYAKGEDSYDVTDFTVFARSLLDDDNAATARTTLGLGIGVNVQAWDSDLDTIAGLAKTANYFMMGNGSAWTSASPSTARTGLGVYSATEVNTLLTNRPEIYYNTTANAGTGDYVISVITP